ncbi:MAG: branched-chain-amino-acid transaminase [Candidatus Omnitrophica bacterium]|nr:branched-chain-amino-acid transaminase [Candidatus Omnitrophota bacterium]
MGEHKIFLDGRFLDVQEAKISVFDHGLLYGDGVFEGIRSYNRRIFRLNEHLERMYVGADMIRLAIPYSKSEMQNYIVATLKLNDLSNAYIRVVVTRGVGDLGLDPRKCKKATVFIITDKIALYPEEFYEKGLPIIIAKTERVSPGAIYPGIKSLNYLNSILGKIEAIDAGTNEALMLTKDGDVAECTGDNIFIVKKGVLMTPPHELGTLNGITQKAVMDLAQKRNIKPILKIMKPKEVFAADECFLTGTAAEIIPVTKIDDKVIGDGKPGAVTRLLAADFHELVKVDGIAY